LDLAEHKSLTHHLTFSPPSISQDGMGKRGWGAWRRKEVKQGRRQARYVSALLMCPLRHSRIGLSRACGNANFQFDPSQKGAVRQIALRFDQVRAQLTSSVFAENGCSEDLPEA
jgi:hypothetical protein